MAADPSPAPGARHTRWRCPTERLVPRDRAALQRADLVERSTRAPVRGLEVEVDTGGSPVIVGDAQRRVQRTDGLLEHHLHFAAERSWNGAPIPKHRSCRRERCLARLYQVDKRLPGRRLARAGATDERQCLTAAISKSTPSTAHDGRCRQARGRLDTWPHIASSSTYGASTTLPSRLSSRRRVATRMHGRTARWRLWPTARSMSTARTLLSRSSTDRQSGSRPASATARVHGPG
jgi:hypothetical protein